MSRRRLRIGVIAAVFTLLIIFFLSSKPEYQLVPALRPQTKEDVFAEQIAHDQSKDKPSDERIALKDSLVEAEQAAKAKTAQKDRDRIVLKEANAAKPDTEKELPKAPPSGELIEYELNDLLSKSPIVIFSKTFCPFSRKAKKVFEEYDIVPRPFIVELDEHPYGDELQAKLSQKTQRTTVPNIMIKGQSIGGGNDVQHLHEQGKLLAMIQRMAGDSLTKLSVSEAVSIEEEEET